MYRAIYVLIVLFWVTMTALLLRNEIHPGDSSLREVPPGHVVKLILHHQQASVLNIVSDKTHLGRLRIEPHTDKQNGLHTFTFTGTLALNTLDGERRKIAWDGEVKMNKELDVRQFRVGVTSHEPETLRSEITVLPIEKVVHYELSTKAGILERQDYTLDERGMRDVLRQLGYDPTMLPVVPKPQGMPQKTPLPQTRRIKRVDPG